LTLVALDRRLANAAQAPGIAIAAVAGAEDSAPDPR
jgi:hypothetical protein